MIQQKIANINEFWELSSTLFDLKNIPAPIDDPITTKIAEKKEIFLLFDAWDIPSFFSFSAIIFSLNNITI